MAKRRKKSKTGRRRRVGAMSLNANSTLMKVLPIAAGYFFADKVNAAIDKVTGGKLDSKIVAGGEVGLGYLLAFKGKKSLPKGIAGGLLIGAGAKRLISSMGIGGYGMVPVLGRVNGYQSVPVLGSYKTNGTLAGYKTSSTPIMAGVNVAADGAKGSGSGITNSGGGDCMG